MSSNLRAALLETHFAKYFCALVDGWGAPRHPDSLQVRSHELTCGDVYQFVDLLRSTVETFDGTEGRNGSMNACCYRHLCKAEGKLFARLRDLLEDLNFPALLKAIDEREQKGEPQLPCLVSVPWVHRAAKALGYGVPEKTGDGNG